MENNKEAYVPTETKKEEMIEHVKYEMNMFRNCYVILSIIFKEEGFFTNVFIEEFLLHARNLFTFFYSDVRVKDDAIARDYLINIEDFFSKRSQPDEFKDFKTKWNKMLYHLTYSRLDYDGKKKTWDCTKLFQLIDETEKAFFDSISEDQKERFR
jgi:hypothetical protein